VGKSNVRIYRQARLMTTAARVPPRWKGRDAAVLSATVPDPWMKASSSHEDLHLYSGAEAPPLEDRVNARVSVACYPVCGLRHSLVGRSQH